MPETWLRIGTPASISESDDAQTEPIDVEPLEDKTSETNLRVYGNFSFDGTTESKALSAKAPWPISLRLGPRIKPASPVENGGKL